MFSYRIMNSVGVQSLRRPVTDDIGNLAKIQLFYVRFGQKDGAGIVHIDGKWSIYHAHPRGVKRPLVRKKVWFFWRTAIQSLLSYAGAMRIIVIFQGIATSKCSFTMAFSCADISEKS